MDSNNINYKEEVLKAGLIMAGVSIIMTMLIYVINIELMVSWWFGLMSLALSMGIAIYLGISYRNLCGGFLSYKESLKFSFLAFLVSYAIGIVFNILLYTVIDPGLPEVMKDLTMEATVGMLESFGTPQEVIDASMVEIENSVMESTSPSGILKSSPWGVLIMFLFAVIASIFIKKNEPISDRIN